MSNPFRTDPHPSLSRTISEIVAPKGEKPAKPYDKYEGKPKPKSRVDESHTSEELEGLSITRLLELKKKYERLVLRGDKNASRELADIRGLLRAKGAGSVLDEGRKGLGKTQYGKALAKMGAAVDAYNKSPKPKPPVNPFKKVDESAPTTAAEWTAANRPSRETAKALQAGMKKFLSKYGKGKPAKPAAAPVREGASPCEQGALDAVRRANAADLKEYPGKRGERAHARLHKTIGKILKQ